MPIEVINLLSSPESERLLLLRPPLDGSEAPTRDLSKRRLNHDSHNLTERSPKRSRSDLAVPRAALAVSRDVNKQRRGPQAGWLLSDESGPIGNEDVPTENTILSPSAKRSQPPSVAEGLGAAVAQTWDWSATAEAVTSTSRTLGGMRRLHSIDDPIEVSSSPHVSFSSKLPPQAAPREDDPFASSPKTTKVDEQRHKVPSNKDYIDPFASSSPRVRAPSPKRSAIWDPISSSAPEASVAERPSMRSPKVLQRSRSVVIALDDSASDDNSAAGGSSDEFSDIADFDPTKLRRRVPSPKPLKNRLKAPVRSSKAGKTTTAKKAPEEKAREKLKKDAAREADKLRKQKEKEGAKEQRALEKERAAALAEVNKVRTDKKISTPEMIVDLPASLPDTTTLQAQTLLHDLDVQHTSWASSVDHVVKWRRKVRARFDDELGHWEPIPMRIEPEKHAMVILSASEFVQYALARDETDLETHVLKMRSNFPEHTLIYLIEGLTPWMRKNRSIRNRQFVSAVRSGLDDLNVTTAGDSSSVPPPSAQPRRRKNNASRPQQEYVDEDAIEEALLQLQVLYGAMIHHTAAAVETAQWIAIFTQHISTIPYRRQKEASNDAAGFCMETGQVRTGDGPRDTYVRMLQEIARVTAPIAYGVAAELGTVGALVRGLGEGGPLRLEGVRKSANKDGAFSDRAVGQAVSRRLHKVFTGRDETSTDV